jgi:hypothetical protein
VNDFASASISIEYSLNPILLILRSYPIEGSSIYFRQQVPDLRIAEAVDAFASEERPEDGREVGGAGTYNVFQDGDWPGFLPGGGVPFDVGPALLRAKWGKRPVSGPRRASSPLQVVPAVGFPQVFAQRQVRPGEGAPVPVGGYEPFAVRRARSPCHTSRPVSALSDYPVSPICLSAPSLQACASDNPRVNLGRKGRAQPQGLPPPRRGVARPCLHFAPTLASRSPARGIPVRLPMNRAPGLPELPPGIRRPAALPPRHFPEHDQLSFNGFLRKLLRQGIAV